ncbi:MAG: PaaI family thioesterase [Clostridiales bacterium]|nr:PaaI family thioesterase [Clostridiales bacterium]
MDEKDVIKLINDNAKFTKYNNMVITKIGLGTAEGEMPVVEEAMNHYGGVHGGALFSLADNVAGVAAVSRKTACVTLGASIHYFKQVKDGLVKAVATETNRSRKTGLYEVNMYDETGELVAKAEFTYYDTEKPIGNKDI